MSQIDQEAFKKLGGEIGEIVRDYLREPPYGRERVFTVLNILAGLSGVLIHGAGESNTDELLHWFINAVDGEIEGLQTDERREVAQAQ